MRGRAEGAFETVTSVLDDKRIRYRRLQPEQLSLSPSPRLQSKCLVLGFGTPALTIYISEVRENKLLFVAYRKSLRCEVQDEDQLQARVLGSNAEEAVCMWKIELKGGSLFPVAEMMMDVSGDIEAARGQIWEAFTTLDTFFREGESVFGLLQLTVPEIAEAIRTLLHKQGFTRFNEKVTAADHNFIFTLANNQDIDNSAISTFPIQITLKDFITFRAFFAVEGKVILMKIPVKNAIMEIIPHVNWRLGVGHYDCRGNLSLCVTLPYKRFTMSDLESSLESCLNSLVTGYVSTVETIFSVYQQALNGSNEVQDPFFHLQLLREDTKGELYYEQIQYNPKDLSLFYLLQSNPGLAPYFLPNPYYFSDSSNRLYRKTAKSLLSLAAFVEKSPFARRPLYSQITVLYDKLHTKGFFPTLEMVGVMDGMRLVIVLGSGIHNDSIRFLKECIGLFLETGKTANISQKCDYMIEFSAFLDCFEHKIEANSTIISANIGSEAYFLHPMEEESSDLSKLLDAYRSSLCTLQINQNTLIGWTQSSDFLSIFDDFERNKRSVFMCERAKYRFWTPKNVFRECLQLLSSLENLHKFGQFHLFLSFATIRQDPISTEIALVLPCIDLMYAEFLSTFLANPSEKYQAPEVKAYLACRVPIERPDKADVYSICRVIAEAARRGKRTLKGSLRDLVGKGGANIPGERPGLLEIKEALRVAEQEETPGLYSSSQ